MAIPNMGSGFHIPGPQAQNLPVMQTPDNYTYLIAQADGSWVETEINEERPSLMQYDYRTVGRIGPRGPGGGTSKGFGGGGF